VGGERAASALLEPAPPRGASHFGPDRRLGRALRLAVVLAPLVVLTVADLPVCLTAAFTGLPCPGCGLSRAAFALLRGDLPLAFQLNPLAPLVVPLSVVGFGTIALRYVWVGRTDYQSWVIWVVGLLSGALVLVWLARFLGAFGGPVAV
jgi:hypothetical protein